MTYLQDIVDNGRNQGDKTASERLVDRVKSDLTAVRNVQEFDSVSIADRYDFFIVDYTSSYSFRINDQNARESPPYRCLDTTVICRSNVASVGSVFKSKRKVKVLSVQLIQKKEKWTFWAKFLRTSQRRAFASSVEFSFIVSGSERTAVICAYRFKDVWFPFGAI